MARRKTSGIHAGRPPGLRLKLDAGLREGNGNGNGNRNSNGNRKTAVPLAPSPAKRGKVGMGADGRGDPDEGVAKTRSL